MTKRVKRRYPYVKLQNRPNSRPACHDEMVEEAKEGFRARNIDQWQKGEPNEQGLTEGIEKALYMSWKKMEKF